MEEDGGGQLFQKMRGEEVAKGTSYKEFIQPVPFAHVRALDQEQDWPPGYFSPCQLPPRSFSQWSVDSCIRFTQGAC